MKGKSESLMKCPNCGASIYDDVNRCQYCGAYTANSAQQPAPAPYAQYQAGAQTTAQPPQPIIYNVINQIPAEAVNGAYRVPVSSKSKWVAFFLCVFFSYLGFHKFYVGKVGAGILYLFTVGLFGFGWIIDAIVILCGSSTDKWGRKLV